MLAATSHTPHGSAGFTKDSNDSTPPMSSASEVLLQQKRRSLLQRTLRLGASNAQMQAERDEHGARQEEMREQLNRAKQDLRSSRAQAQAALDQVARLQVGVCVCVLRIV